MQKMKRSFSFHIGKRTKILSALTIVIFLGGAVLLYFLYTGGFLSAWFTSLVLAVTLHNIPEGMAVGVVLAGMLTDNATISVAAAMALSIGIAIQNFPEGAIVSMPLKQSLRSKWKAFAYVQVRVSLSLWRDW